MKKTSILALMMTLLLLLSACTAAPPVTEPPADGPTDTPPAETPPAETPDEGRMLYDEAPSKYQYGVYVNMNTAAGDALTDYSVAFNNFADRDAYVLYSTQGLTPVTEQLSALDGAGLEALAAEGKALKIRTNDGFHPLTAELLSLEGHAFDPQEKEQFYYLYAAYEGTDGVAVEKSGRFLTPKEGPAALETYGSGKPGALVPAGGATSVFTESSSYSPDYVAALTQSARDAGIERPRVAVIETTMGNEQALYDDFYLPADGYDSFSETLYDRGMEPVYIPLGLDNCREVQNTGYFADLVRSCHIVFFTGGDQAYYAYALVNEDGTPSLLAQAINDVVANGGTLGGSSAGAAAMSGTVLSNGASGSYQPLYWNGAETVDITTYTAETLPANSTAQEGNNLLYDSIGFVEPVLGRDILLDTHVDARGRIGRLIAGLREADPKGMAIGLDETAGLRIDGSTGVGTAFGTSGVYVIDAANAVWTPAGEVGGFGVEGLTVSYLTVGDQYDFRTGAVLPAADKREIAAPTGEAYVSNDLLGTDELGKTILTFAQSAQTTLSADVANTMIPPFLTGSCYTFTFEKTADTKCYASEALFPDEDYFGDFFQTAVAGLRVSVTAGPSKFDPNAAGEFAPLSAAGEDNGYAVGVTFSGPLSVGYEGNNRYFLDCEEPQNIPEDYVEVRDASGTVKSQDRTYTFRINDETTLRIVLMDGVFFAEGDAILLKTGITSLYGSALEGETTFRLTGGQWVME